MNCSIFFSYIDTFLNRVFQNRKRAALFNPSKPFKAAIPFTSQKKTDLDEEDKICKVSLDLLE